MLGVGAAFPCLRAGAVMLRAGAVMLGAGAAMLGVVAALLLGLAATPRVALASSPLIGFNFPISQALVPGTEAGHPALAYNSARRQYLVVWEEENVVASAGGVADEIFGRLLNSDGTAVAIPFQVSFTATASSRIGAAHPSVAYNEADDEYLVVWERDTLVLDAIEIWVQRVSADGMLAGTPLQVSLAAASGGDARHPSVARNSVAQEFLVVWEHHGSGTLVDADIHGRRVVAGPSIFGNLGTSFAISQMSSVPAAPSANRGAFAPDVAYDAVNNRYLVVWMGDGGLPDDTYEVFGQLLNGVGAAIGADDFRISEMSAAGADRDGFDPAVSFNGVDQDYLVVWSGDGGSLAASTYEVFGQLVAADGGLLIDDFQISNASAAGADRDAFAPAVGYNATNNRYLVVWHADGAPSGLPIRAPGGGTAAAAVPAAGVHEIFGQQLSGDGTETDDDFQISTMAAAGADRDARAPALPKSGSDAEFLVVWDGDGGAQADDDDEVFGQRFGIPPVPVAVTGLQASERDGAVVVSWMAAVDGELVAFDVDRAARSEGPYLRRTSESLRGSGAFEFVDADVTSGATYFYRIAVSGPGSGTVSFGPVAVTLAVAAVGRTALFPSRPNPFRESTTLSFGLARRATAAIDIYDVAGRRVRRLGGREFGPGVHALTWDGRDTRGHRVPRGVYFYRLVAGGRTLSSKMVLTGRK